MKLTFVHFIVIVHSKLHFAFYALKFDTKIIIIVCGNVLVNLDCPESDRGLQHFPIYCAYG